AQVCPAGRTILVGLFEERELWSSIALRRGPGSVDLILGPDEVRGDMGPLAGAWARAVAVRDLILSPVLAALAIPAGGRRGPRGALGVPPRRRADGPPRRRR